MPRTKTIPQRAASPAKMLISEIMTANPVSVDRSTPARELARILLDNEISGVPVLDERDRVIGVVSRPDLLMRFIEGPRASAPMTFLETMAEGLDVDTDVDPDQLGYVEDFMTPDPLTISPDATIGEVARLMAEERVHRVIVVDREGQLAGIVTTMDVLRVFPR